MERHEYLQQTLQDLQRLVEMPSFTNQAYQVRARAIVEEFGRRSTTPINFTFEPKQVSRYCDFILGETILLLREETGDKSELLRYVKTAGETFEFLAKFSNIDEREMLLLNSALCYHIAGYQANAYCIGRLVDREFVATSETPSNIDERLALTFRQLLTKFLQRDISRLEVLSSAAAKQVLALQESFTGDLYANRRTISDLMELTAHAFFYRAIESFVEYCLNGNESVYSTVLDQIRKSYTYFKRANEATFGTITTELETVIQLFHERSTWNVVTTHLNTASLPRTWQAYLSNLARTKSIVEFWPSQVNAIGAGILNSELSYVVQMPTSAGKTFIAELAILSALTSSEGVRCLYIAPYRALVNEVQAKLADSLGSVGYRVSNLVGGFEFDSLQDLLVRTSDVLVATPEKVELLLRTSPEYFDEVDVIVIDEGHIVDEGVSTSENDGKTLLQMLEETGTLGRGPLLEFLVNRVRTLHPSTRFIFLSAVMPEINADDFVSWLSYRKTEPLRIDPESRPARQVLAEFEWKVVRGVATDNGELEYLSLPKLANGKHPFVPHFLSRKKYYTGARTPTGRLQQKTWPENRTNKAQAVAMLACQFASTGPTLIFCAQRSHALDVLQNVVLSLQYLEASGQLPDPALAYDESPDIESFELSVAWLGEDHLLSKALRRGAALHYGPLPDPLRQAIENDFRSGHIKLLISTNTLGQGVNLPIRTALIYSVERSWPKRDESGTIMRHPWGNNPPIMETSKLKRRDFWNICGRAGRAGKETEGQVIFVAISPNDANLLAEYVHVQEFEEVESSLYVILQALIENRITQDDLIGYLDSYVLALLVEEIIGTNEEEQIAEFLGSSLVGIQAYRKGVDLASLTSAVVRVSGWVKDRVPETARRRVYASTGLRVVSCEVLEQVAEELLERQTADSFSSKQDIRYDELVVRSAFRACINLPEMILDAQIKYSGPLDEYELFSAWINEVPIAEIRQLYWAPEQTEGFGRYLSDRLTYKLPWGINGFLQMLAFKFNREFDELPLSWTHLPAMTKFGVATVPACWAASLGITSRSFAAELSELYMNLVGIVDLTTFVGWVRELGDEFVNQNIRGSKFEKQRFLDVRRQLNSTRDRPL